MICKHCKKEISVFDEDHDCSVGLLGVDREDSTIVSAAIGFATDSALLGGIFGGDIIGGVVGDILDGDLFD